MKRLLSVILILTISLTALAQKMSDSKNLAAVADEQKIDLNIDFSNASILGVDFEDWVTGEPDWDQSYSEIRVKFIQAFNSIADRGRHPHRAGSAPNSSYLLHIKIEKVKDDGSEVHALVCVENKEGNTIYEKSMKGEQGRFGSVANLMGDAMEDLGYKVGRLFSSNAK